MKEADVCRSRQLIDYFGQSAEKDSRMFLITTMIRDDFVKLTLDDGKDKEEIPWSD